jgi:hypothetical protein
MLATSVWAPAAAPSISSVPSLRIRATASGRRSGASVARTTTPLKLRFQVSRLARAEMLDLGRMSWRAGPRSERSSQSMCFDPKVRAAQLVARLSVA